MSERYRIVGGVHIEHPGAIDRERGVQSQAFLMVDRRLRGGRLDRVELSELDLLDLLVEGAKVLRTLRLDHGRKGSDIA